MMEIDFIQPKKTVGKLISVDVLDKIKAEIEQEYKVESGHPYGQGLRWALEIIDKYITERG